jgi:hypothetical protein
MYLNRRTNTFADSTPEHPVPARDTMLLTNVLSNYTELGRGFEAGDANPYKRSAMIEP